MKLKSRFATWFRHTRMGCAMYERFVEKHYHVYMRLNGGDERRVVLPPCKLDPEFVADPFLFRHEGTNWLFFEGMYANRGHRGRDKGVIGCLKQVADGWKYVGVVLEEPWHLSYPQVFEQDGRLVMIPESGQSGAVSLYECDEFPLKWRKCGDLIRGNCNYVDAAFVCQDGVFYLVVAPADAALRPMLWKADSIDGPWTIHPQSDHVSSSLRVRRNGGAFVREGNRLYRIAQDCEGGYGRQLFRVPVLQLTPNRYEEGCPESLSESIRWPQPLPHHTYNRLEWDASKLEVVDRHYNAVKRGRHLAAALFWFFVDGVGCVCGKFSSCLR